MAKWWEDTTLYQTSKPAAAQNSGGKWWDDQSLYQAADTSSPIKQKIARSMLNAETGSRGYDESLLKQRESGLDPRINYNAIDPLNIRNDGEATSRYINIRDNLQSGEAQDNTDYFGLNFNGNGDVAKKLSDQLGVKGRRASETLSQIHQRYYPDLAPDRFATLVGLTPKTDQEKEADIGLTPKNGLGWWESTKEAFKSGAAAPVAGVVRAYADLTGNDQMAANSEAALRGISQAIKDAKHGKGKLGSLAVSAVNSAPLMIATAATGGLGASAAGATALGTGAMFTGAAAQKYGQNRAEGYDVGDSASNAAITGAIEAGTEAIPFAKALAPAAKGVLGQLSRTAKTAGMEGISEVYATAGEALADKATLGKDINGRQLASNILESAATGGLVGGILAAPSTIKDITRKTDTADASADLGAELVKNTLQEKQAKELQVQDLEKAEAEENAALEKLLVEKAQLEFDQRAKQELDAARASAGRVDVGLAAGRAEQIAAEIASNYGVTPESILRNDMAVPNPTQLPAIEQSPQLEAKAPDLPLPEAPPAAEIQQASPLALPQGSLLRNEAGGRIEPTISSFDVVPRETLEPSFNSINDRQTFDARPTQLEDQAATQEFIESSILEVQNARIPRGSFKTVDEAKVAAKQAWGKAVDRLERNGVLSFISTEELANLAPEALRSADSVNGVKGVYINGKAHIIADQVKAEELPGVILHEVGVHHGFKGMVGDEKFIEIKTSLQGLKEKNKDVQAAYAAVPKDTPENLVDEEALAYLIENKPGHGVVRRAMDAVIGFLNKLGFPMSKLEGDVAGLRRMARESLRQSSKQTAPVAAQSAAPQEVAPAQDQNMQVLGNAWVELGKSDKLYKYPKANERDASLEDFVKTVAPDVQVEKVYEEDGETAYNLTSPDGKPGTLVIEPDGTMQLDINKFEEGKSGGGRLYSALYQFAEKNGLKAAPDRTGLSKVNEYRRTEHMLSSAIKSGKTSHLVPDVTQGLTNWKESKGAEDDAANIGSMAYTSMRNVLSSVPEMNGVRYNFDTNNFETSAGKEVTDADFDRIAESQQAREIGAGRTTLKRAAWTSSVVQREGGADGAELLARSSREQLERVPTGTVEPRLKGVAYSKRQTPSITNKLPDTIEVDGKQRSTTNSNGKPIAQDEASIRNFWKWFGDSKVVDVDGRPLVVYHGTGSDFDVFQNMPGRGAGGRSARLGFFFSESPNTASTYAEEAPEFARNRGYSRVRKMELSGDWAAANALEQELESPEYTGGMAPSVMPAYLSIQNPTDSDFGGREYDAGSDNISSLIQDAKKAGHDGVILRNFDDPVRGSDPTNHFIAFNSEQIKSAIGNTGKFDPANPDIRYSKRVEPTLRESSIDFGSNPEPNRKPSAPIVQQRRAEAKQNREKLRNELDVTAPVSWDMDKSNWEGWRGKVRNLRRNAQDKMLVFRDVQQDIQEQRGAIEDAMNFYRRENLMSGRVGDRTDLFERNHVKPLYEAMKKAGVKPDVLEQYLYAKHAEERNASVAKINPDMADGGSGLTTKEAKDILNKFKSEGKDRDLERLANMVYEITEMSRKNLLDSGVISQEQYDAMKAKYKYYVPLRGKDGVEPGMGTGRGLDISRGSGIKRALGRGEGNIAKNILAEVLADQVRSIQTMEKVRVMKTVMRLALQNKNSDLWEVEPVKVEKKYSDAAGQAYETVANLRNDDGILLVPFNGRRYQLLFKDKRLAEAYKNLNAEQLGSVIKMGSRINQYLSAMFTRYNPSFVLINATRDAIFGMTAIAAEHGAKAALFVAKNYPKAVMGLWRDSAGKGDSEWANYAREYTEDGGKTIFKDSQSVEDLAKDIQDEFKSFGNLIREGKPYRAVAKKFGDSKIVQTIERTNDVIENAMRLSAYVALRNKGKSREQAAEYAKNFTVNFNRRGQKTSVLNALYLFFNASMQGGHRTLSLLKNKKVQAAMAALAGTQALLATYALSFTDDEDENAWDKIPEWEKLKNIIIPVPRMVDGKIKATTIKIPMPYGFNLFSYGGGRIAKLIHGLRNEVSPGKVSTDFVKDMMSGAAQAFSPLPFEQKGWGAVLPYYVNVGLSLKENKDDLGMRIRNENPYEKYDKPRIAYGRADTNKAFKAVATGLNRLGGGDDVTPPIARALLDWAPEDLEYLTKTATGGLGSFGVKSANLVGRLIGKQKIRPNDVPILNSFVAEVDDNRIVANQYYDIAEEIERDLDRLKMGKKKGESLDESLNILDPSSINYREYKKNGVELLERPKIESSTGSLLYVYRDVGKDLDENLTKLTKARFNSNLGYSDQQKEIERLQKERAETQQRLITAWKREKKRKQQ